MKPLFLLSLLAFTMNVTSQNYAALARIDSIVSVINASPKNMVQDSTIQSLPAYGLAMKTYISAVVEGDQLKKYTNYVITDKVEAGVSKHLITNNTFYYFQNELIKVEEFVLENNRAHQFFFYFQNDKCLYASLPPDEDKARDRPTLLLSMAKGIKEKTLARP